MDETKINARGDDKPTMADLNRHVVPYLADNWKDLASLLLKDNHLDLTKEYYDIHEYARKSLEIWCKNTYASWNKLITELEKILPYLAEKIKMKLLPAAGGDIDTKVSSSLLFTRMNSNNHLENDTMMNNHVENDTMSFEQRILKTVSKSYQTHLAPKHRKKCSGVVAALVLENQNRTEDIFETVILTVGSKFNDNQKCEYKKDGYTWALCDCHAEALCYQLSGLYMLTEIYKLHKKLSSIFCKISDSEYQLKSGIKFHLFTSYHPCGFMADGEKSFLSWKAEFIGMPHIPECSSKILIGAYLGIQGPLSSLLVQGVFVSSVVILHNKQSKKKDLLCEDGIRKCFDDFRGKLNDDSKKCFHAPTIYIIDEDLDDITKKFQYPIPPNSRGHKKSDIIGFVFPKVDGQKIWVKKFTKTDFHEVGKEIETYYQNLKKLLSSLLSSTTTTELPNNIKTLSLALKVSTSVQNAVKEQAKKYRDHLTKENIAIKEIIHIDLQFLHKNDEDDTEIRHHPDKLSIYCPEETDSGCDEDGKVAVNKGGHLLKKEYTFSERVSLLIVGIQKMYESLNDQRQLTLIDVDCGCGRYI